ncbi:hypothetical protein RUM44_006442 [Polyplax serrata]|uniref:Male-enhanced antigen 1 n=1 Tax=Polyplax serrata TaxID=468196 RepID=A0ABR1AI38_POLSC
MGLKNNLDQDCTNRPKEDSLSTDGVGIMPAWSSSDSEDDDVSFGTYSALPQDVTESNEIHQGDEEDDDEDNDSDINNGDIAQNYCVENEGTTSSETYGFDRATKFEMSELWNSTDNRSTDIVMDSAKVEQIKHAMAGFKLPSTVIPPWAEKIPEEEWKEQIINKIVLRKLPN